MQESRITPSGPVINPDWVPDLQTALHEIDVSEGFDGDFVNPAVIERLARKQNRIKIPFPERLTGLDCKQILSQLEYPADTEAWARPRPGQECGQLYRYEFYSNGPAELQQILDTWAANPVSDRAPNLRIDGDNYFHQDVVSRLAVHYAVFYEAFTNRTAIDAWLSEWLQTYTSHRPPNKSRCPFNEPSRYATHRDSYSVDGCGSNHWRNAVAKIALGIRIGDQALYRSGVRNLEINLAMFDESGIFVPYAARGADSPGYAIDIPEYLSAIALFYSAINVDLWGQLGPKGRPIGNLLESTLAWLRDPELAGQYWKGTLTCNDGRCDTLRSMSQIGSLEDWQVLG
ncbi:MAG: hypothetical protein ACPGU3_10255, partial [Litorivicinus sp.]